MRSMSRPASTLLFTASRTAPVSQKLARVASALVQSQTYEMFFLAGSGAKRLRHSRQRPLQSG
jgi:hypothetical protein